MRLVAEIVVIDAADLSWLGNTIPRPFTGEHDRSSKITNHCAFAAAPVATTVRKIDSHAIRLLDVGPESTLRSRSPDSETDETVSDSITRKQLRAVGRLLRR